MVGFLLFIACMWFVGTRLNRFFYRERGRGVYAGWGRPGPGRPYGWGGWMQGGCGSGARSGGGWSRPVEESRPAAQAAAPPRLTERQRHEQELQILQRRYVRDDITVEQYEAELDRLLKRG